MRDLSTNEKISIEVKLENFLDEKIFTMKCLDEDHEWDGEGDSMEEKIIKELIKTLQNRLDYY